MFLSCSDVTPSLPSLSLQTPHTSQAREVCRLSSGTSHRLRCVLAIRSVQDDVSNQPYRRSEGCCLKGIQLLRVSTRRLRSWGACHHHRSRVGKSKQYSELCDISGSPAPAETHLILVPAYCPFQELDFSEVTTTHTSQHLGFELVCPADPAARRPVVVSVTPARSCMVSAVTESKHHLARLPSVRSEYSHVVPLPPFRSHSSAIERLQQQEELSFFQQAVLGNYPTNSSMLSCTNAATMSWNAMLRGRCFPSRVVARLTIILNAFRAGVPACTSYLTSLATSAAANLLLARLFFVSSTNLPRTILVPGRSAVLGITDNAS